MITAICAFVFIAGFMIALHGTDPVWGADRALERRIRRNLAFTLVGLIMMFGAVITAVTLSLQSQ